MDLETLKKIETAASSAPWKPNCIHETEGDGAWGAGPLVELTADEDIEILERGDWCQEDQERLAIDDANLIAALRNLAPEILQMTRCAQELNDYNIPGEAMLDSVRAFNLKLAAQ